MLVIRRNLRIVTAIVLASALFVAACSDVTPSDGASSTAADSARSYSFPIALGSMTTVWQASPGISLTTPDATLVRAFFESRFIVEVLGMPYAFPGFADTVRIVQNSIYDIPEGHPSADDRRAGTRRLMLLSLARTDDHLDALVCDDQAGLYFEKNIGHKDRGLPPLFDLRDGRWFMPDAFPYSVSLRRSGRSVWHPTVDRDTDRAPNWNVFTGWTAKQNRLNLDGSNSILCSNWASRNYPGIPSGQSQGAPQRIYPTGPTDPAFQPTLPQSPGWTRLGQR